jgi:hypothetical protein
MTIDTAMLQANAQKERTTQDASSFDVCLGNWKDVACVQRASTHAARALAATPIIALSCGREAEAPCHAGAHDYKRFDPSRIQAGSMPRTSPMRHMQMLMRPVMHHALATVFTSVGSRFENRQRH